MAHHISSMSFGDGNRVIQVGLSNAPILQASFNLPPGTLDHAYNYLALLPRVDSANILSRATRTYPVPIRMDSLPS